LKICSPRAASPAGSASIAACRSDCVGSVVGAASRDGAVSAEVLEPADTDEQATTVNANAANTTRRGLPIECRNRFTVFVPLFSKFTVNYYVAPLLRLQASFSNQLPYLTLAKFLFVGLFQLATVGHSRSEPDRQM
jgi:hypothetical protein